jgi:3,4-dihydroxy 2-butanone 4-phosphate synthase/GTP cyclohydrolase II
MQRVSQEGRGVIVYLRGHEGRGIGLLQKLRAYELQDQGADTIEANERLGFAADMRSYEQCAEVLLDLGLRSVRVMSDNPAKIQALRQAGLKVVERVPLDVEPHDSFVNYLKTKKEKMGHLVSVAS